MLKELPFSVTINLDFSLVWILKRSEFVMFVNLINWIEIVWSDNKLLNILQILSPLSLWLMNYPCDERNLEILNHKYKYVWENSHKDSQFTCNNYEYIVSGGSNKV